MVMKKLFSTFAASVLFVLSAAAADTNAASSDAEAKYTKAIEGRTADILKILDLGDTNKITKVHDAIIAQYRALNAWHNENDAKLKTKKSDTNAVAQIRAMLKVLHEKFLAALAENLSPEQVEKVKDKMTYGKVQFTFNGYVSQYPNLSNENQNEILRMLKDAREEAMDGGSADEKTAVFQRYKGKINNYLSKQGIHAEKKKPASVLTNSPAEK
jgi:Spy/CpxP family protein refolding chaperone